MPDTIPYSQSQQYKILRADLSADRLGDQTINIGNVIDEINLYEHLEKPYVTGRVLIIDDENLLDDINFSGTETLELRMSGVDNNLGEYMVRRFSVVSVEHSIKANDRVEVHVLNIIDEAAYLSFAKRFSKSYKGKIEDIITGIITSELGVDVDRSYGSTSSQGAVKLVVPYLTPLQACDWLRNRITTINGSPWFVYSSIYDDKIRVGDLDTMIYQDSFNKELPFIYSSGHKNFAELQNDVAKSMTITKVSRSNMENTLDIIKIGGIGCKISSTDITGGQTLSHNYSVRDTIRTLERANIIREGYQQNVFDINAELDHSILGPKPIDEYPSRFFHEIGSSNVYSDADNFSTSQVSSDLNQKASNNSIRNLFYKNMIDVELNGTAMFYSQVSVGDMIRLHFQSANVKVGPSVDPIDRNRSGDYLIYASKHVFRDNKHSVTVSVSKITKRVNAAP